MSDDNKHLKEKISLLSKEKISLLSDEELFQMIEVNYKDYSEEALNIAKDLAKKRIEKVCHEEEGQGGTKDTNFLLEMQKMQQEEIVQPEIEEDKQQISINKSSGFYSSFLPLAGVLMAIVGLIASFYAFTNAKSGWGRIDNTLIFVGAVIIVYQFIITILCFGLREALAKVGELEFKLNNTTSFTDS